MAKEKPTTKICKYCKSEIDYGAKICPHCRKRQNMHPVLAVILIIIGFSMMIGGIAGATSGGSSSSSSTKLSKEEFIATCNEYDYKDISRNPDNYKNKNCYFRGKIVQVSESGFSTIYRISVTENKLYSDELMETMSDYIDESANLSLWEDELYVEYNVKDGDSRFLEEDIVKLYGTIKGLKTYTAVLGNQITIPEIYAEYIELDNQ